MSDIEIENLKMNCTYANITGTAVDSPETVLGDGICSSESCPSLSTFLLIMWFGLFFTFMNATPASIIQLRCIPTHHSAISLALADVVSKILGNIPGPLVFASFMDAACLVKSIAFDDNCEKLESCAVFDNDALIEAVAIKLALIFKSCSAICCLMCFLNLRGTIEGEQSYDKHVVDKGGDQKGFRKLSVEIIQLNEERSVAEGSTGGQLAVGRKRRPTAPLKR